MTYVGNTVRVIDGIRRILEMWYRDKDGATLYVDSYNVVVFVEY